ncbi:MAG: hypothetical protein KAZ30_04440 [Candidatus Magasanikbacteria bacterium]|nr:hypothetical protein [Candidatus Magasanikbacteria bacterium]
MLEQLFGSKTRVKLLRALYRHPEKSYFVRELTRVLDAQINAVRREIEQLASIGLLLESEEMQTADEQIQAGSSLRKYYKLNKDCLIYNELQALLLKEQLSSEEDFVKELQNGKVGEIEFLLMSGRFTHDEQAPSDVLVIGNVKEKVLAKMVAEYEVSFGFPIRYTAMTKQEFFDRRYVMDKFIFSLFEAKHVKVVNKFDL